MSVISETLATPEGRKALGYSMVMPILLQFGREKDAVADGEAIIMEESEL